MILFLRDGKYVGSADELREGDQLLEVVEPGVSVEWRIAAWVQNFDYETINEAASFTHATKGTYELGTIEEFSELHGIPVSHATRLVQGAIKSYKGWRYEA